VQLGFIISSERNHHLYSWRSESDNQNWSESDNGTSDPTSLPLDSYGPRCSTPAAPPSYGTWLIGLCKEKNNVQCLTCRKCSIYSKCSCLAPDGEQVEMVSCRPLMTLQREYKVGIIVMPKLYICTDEMSKKL